MTKIAIVSIPVSDQEQAKAFYVDRLGWELVRDEPMGPQRWLEVRPRGGEASATLVTWFESMPPGSVRGIVIETDDLEAAREALRDSGVRVDDQISEAPWGRWVSFDDPDGNGFVLQASAPGRRPASPEREADHDLQDAFD